MQGVRQAQKEASQHEHGRRNGATKGSSTGGTKRSSKYVRIRHRQEQTPVDVLRSSGLCANGDALWGEDGEVRSITTSAEFGNIFTPMGLRLRRKVTQVGELHQFDVTLETSGMGWR